jgi:hypothetical protein
MRTVPPDAARPQMAGRHRISFENLHDRFHNRRCAEGRTARKQCVKDGAESVDIGSHTDVRA